MQILELLAWGAERKEIPGLLQKQFGGKEISVNTVNNTIANIYSKLSLQNEKELAAYYFVNYQGVPASKDPLKQLRRAIYAILFLIILLPQITNLDQMLRPSNAKATLGIVRGARGVRGTGRAVRVNGRRRADE